MSSARRDRTLPRSATATADGGRGERQLGISVRAGRASGAIYPKSFRFDEDVIRRLAALRGRLGEPEAAVLRRGLVALEEMPDYLLSRYSVETLREIERQVLGACANINQTVRILNGMARRPSGTAVEVASARKRVEELSTSVDAMAKALRTILDADQNGLSRVFVAGTGAGAPRESDDQEAPDSSGTERRCSPSLTRLSQPSAGGKAGEA